MDRIEFVKKCAAMGIGISLFPSLLVSCKDDETIQSNFKGKVLIIGAGAAGMMAGYTFRKYKINFDIIEASGSFGGRVKINRDFADFPIDMGAEWIHYTPKVFSELIDDKNVKGSIDLIPYKSDDTYRWTRDKLVRRNIANTYYGEYKFKSTTWYQFFERYIYPSIQERLMLNRPVVEIDYSGDQIKVKDASGIVHTADKVLITVPLNVLKNNSIQFVPALPDKKTEAINKTTMPAGIKVFIKFSKKFYPDIVDYNDVPSGDDRTYYNAAYRKDSNVHVLGLFNAGDSAKDFTDLGSDAEIIKAVLQQLDTMFDSQASQYYLDHVVQNWSAEPYVGGAYSFGGKDYKQTIEDIKDPVNGKLFFAGEALHQDNWATVHGAGFSGVEVAKEITQSSD